MFSQLKNILLKTEEGKFKLNQKASIFLFCLSLSTFFWFLSVLGKNYTTTLKFYINYKDYSSDFILTEEPTNFIEGEIFGSGYELLGEQLSLSSNKIDVSLKSAKSTTVENKYYIDTRQLRDQLKTVLDRDLQLNAIVQDSILFYTQKRLSKSVQIKADVDLDIKAGFALRGDLVISPKIIQISGPKSYIDTVSHIRTISTEFSNIEDSTIAQLELLLPKDINGIEASKKEVELLIPVEKHTEKRLTLDIELMGNYDFTIKTFPEQVDVVCLVPLSVYNMLNDKKLRAVAKISQQENNSKLKVEIKGLPDYAKLIRVEPEKVEYIIRK